MKTSCRVLEKAIKAIQISFVLLLLVAALAAGVGYIPEAYFGYIFLGTIVSFVSIEAFLFFCREKQEKIEHPAIHH